MGEAVVGETRSSNGGRWGRPACSGYVGIMLGGDGGLAAELLVCMVEISQEISPSVVLGVTHAPLTDGLRVDAHGFKDSDGGSDNSGPRNIVVSNRKELELSLAGPESDNGL